MGIEDRDYHKQKQGEIEKDQRHIKYLDGVSREYHNGVMECPSCHIQAVKWDSANKLFACFECCKVWSKENYWKQFGL